MLGSVVGIRLWARGRTIMRLKYTFEAMKFDGQYVAVPVDADDCEYRGVVKMNETALFILNLLKNDISEEAIVDAIAEQYDAGREVLAEDVKKYINAFREKGFLVE